MVEDLVLAGRIHRHVRNGNDKHAALGNKRTAVVDDATSVQLEALDAPVPLPIPPLWTKAGWSGPCGCRFLGILHRLPQGTAAGLRG